MVTPEDRIRELAKREAIGEADAAQLLAAVAPAAARRSWNPFERFSPELLIGIGVLGAAGGLALSRLGVGFNGALDMHSAGRTVIPFRTAILDHVAALPVTIVVFWAVARALAKHVRLLDMIAVVGFSRVILPVVGLPLALLDKGQADKIGMAMLIVVVTLALVGVGVHLTLLVFGFRTATGLRGGKLAGGIIGALFVAEVLGKIFLASVH